MTPIAPGAMVLGLDTFGDVTLAADGTDSADGTDKAGVADGSGGIRTPMHQVIADVVAQAELADQVGVDAIGLGEHHRDDFAISAPDIVLAAIASKTSRILLGTAVTVLSSDNPVRVFERFATLDAVSGGRAEITVGRGSFTESFPLFGLDLADYEMLFSEKLDLFVKLLAEGPVSWSGRHRPPLENADVFPKTAAGRIPTWVAVGGSPESVVRAVSHGLPMMLAIIGGDPARFAPYVDLYRRAQQQLGVTEGLPLGVHSPGHVADTDEQAREELWPHFRQNRTRIGRERGWPDPTRAEFDAEVDTGSLYVGSPETVAGRIAATARLLGLDRFDLKYASGPMPHSLLMRSIELYGTQVIPRVRELLAD